MNSLKFNKSDYKFIIIYFIAASIWLLIRWNIEDYTLLEISTGLPAVIIKNLVVLYAFRWLINEYLVIRKNYVIFVLLAFITWEVVGFLDMWRDYYTAQHHWELPSFGLMLIQNFQRGAIDSALLISFVLGKKYYENKLDTIALQNNQKEMELKVLRSQYDPHFLYNSLNTIDALVEYSPKEKVKEYISHLASLYRYLIYTKDEDIVHLDDELALARNYFYLIATRFENDYNFEIVKKQEPMANYLPNGSLLTVLENIVKHNTATEEHSVTTKILIEKRAVRIVNSVLKKKDKVESMGTGLKNLKKRYQLLSDQKLLIEESEISFTITLPLLNLVE